MGSHARCFQGDRSYLLQDCVRGYIARDQKKNNIGSQYGSGFPAIMSCRRRAARCCAGDASTSGRDTHPEENRITRRNALFGAVSSSVLLVSKTSHVRHHQQERYQSCLEMSAPACEAPVALFDDRCVLAACIQSLGSTKVKRCSGWGYNRARTLIHHRLPLCSRKEGGSFSVTCIIGQAPVLVISHRHDGNNVLSLSVLLRRLRMCLYKSMFQIATIILTS